MIKYFVQYHIRGYLGTADYKKLARLGFRPAFQIPYNKNNYIAGLILTALPCSISLQASWFYWREIKPLLGDRTRLINIRATRTQVQSAYPVRKRKKTDGPAGSWLMAQMGKFTIINIPV